MPQLLDACRDSCRTYEGPAHVLYVRIVVVTGPPSILANETPAAREIRSHTATSTAAFPRVSTPDPWNPT
jgi:hypothetical protein